MFERDNDKRGAGRLRTALAIAAVTAVVASMAIVGTVAAQPGQRFFDVPRTHYAYQSIEWAVTNQITRGCGDGRNFCPDNTLNRAEMVTFLKRYHDTFGSDASDDSDDSDDSDESDDSDDPEEHTITGFGSTTYADSITLAAGQYVVDFVLILRSDVDDAIESIEVTVSGPDINSERVLFSLMESHVIASSNRLTFRDRGSFEVRRGLDQLPPGKIYFTVEVEGKEGGPSIASAQWEIRVTER